MSTFIASSSHCAIREESGSFIFHDPANPDVGQASGSWQEAVLLAVRILVHEARVNGGIPGTIFGAAENYANGILSGAVTEQTPEFAEELLQIIAQLKAM